MEFNLELEILLFLIPIPVQNCIKISDSDSIDSILNVELNWNQNSIVSIRNDPLSKNIYLPILFKFK